MEVFELLRNYKEKIDFSLEKFLPEESEQPVRLHKAMRYAVLNGGKRIRPGLVFAVGEALDIEDDTLVIVACAIEFIHVFSLIHDDLPAIDDDELRRGKPACHIEFGEATAILAGDALHTLAFETLAKLSENNISPDALTQVMSFFARTVGSRGLIGGEQIDIEMENSAPTLKEVEHMYSLKTARLIQAALLLPIMVSEVSNKATLLSNLKKIGFHLGVAFQIHDDIIGIESSTKILGKPQCSDLESNKAAIPLILGIKEAKELRDKYFNSAMKQMESLSFDVTNLRAISSFIINRNC